jgi:maltose alpha-D-glucosyltransferase/alpha-amylase
LELEPILARLYGNRAGRMAAEIEREISRSAPAERPAPDLYWYKFLHLYFVYPDAIPDGDGSPLARLIPYLAHVKDLGCNALHILPFLDSPLVDAGFDVSNYLDVRRDLGTMDDLDRLIAEARRLQLHLFMDLVANHVSDQHEWFRRAQAGDEKYRNYFITTDKKPQFVEMFQQGSAVLARYMVNGTALDVNVAFPEFVGEIPHWRQGTDGYWYYHTYYPQQLDLNWHNPDVFLEFARIVTFWTGHGFSLRLDAVPFLGQGAYKRTDQQDRFAEDLGIALREIAWATTPEPIFLVETYESVPAIARYFGTAGQRRAELAYNFHLCTDLWVALTQGSVDSIWNKLDQVRMVPVHAEWLNFLRNHDELSLGYLTDPLLGEVRDALMPNGASFHAGAGISGRTFSLLGCDEARLLNAYFLLASLPGGMLIPYGDEFGVENIPLSQLPEGLRADTRNINRGPLDPGAQKSARGSRIMKVLAKMLHEREGLREYVNVWPARLPAPPTVFAASYWYGTSELLTYVNISDQPQRVEHGKERLGDYRTLMTLGHADASGGTLDLGPYGGIWLEK